MAVIPLLQTANATFGSDGAGGTVARASIGPTVFGASWHITRINISTTSVAPSRLFLYQNVESTGTLIDGSYNGEQDTSETDIQLQTLDRLIGKWIGGTLGAFATITITGTQDNGRG